MNKAFSSSSDGSDGVVKLRWPRLAQTLWVVLAALSLTTLGVAVPARIQQLMIIAPAGTMATGQLSADEVATLPLLGLTLQGYAILFGGLEAIGAIVLLGIGMLMFARGGRQVEPFLLSLALVTFGLNASPLTTPLNNATWPIPIALQLLQATGLLALMLSMLTFPDGRFAPAWVRWFAWAWLIYVLLILLAPSLRFKSSIVFVSADQAVLFGWALASLVVIAGVQVYRYRALASPTQRAQTRWVIFGWTATIMLVAFAVCSMLVLPALGASRAQILATRLIAFTVILIATTLFGTCLAIAILRYRLFDIDVIIRRTLIYGALSALLALLFFGSVVVLQAALQPIFGQLTDQTKDVVIVASTLLIAALALPLRNRVQAVIDRRFYRRRYDAEKVLEAFSARLQNEIDEATLAHDLKAVIQETLQPATVKVWLVSGDKSTEAGS